MAAPTIQLQYGGAWHDVTTDFLRDDATAGGGITIERGASSEASAAEPARCSLVANNGTSRVAPAVSGRYSERNPLSDLYGLIGRNTPLRVALGTVPPSAVTTSNLAISHVAPSVDAAAAGMLICAWLGNDPAGDGSTAYTPPGSMTEQAQPGERFQDLLVATETVAAGATGTRTATYDAFDRRHVAASIVVHGTSVAVEEALSDASDDTGDLGVSPPTLELTTDAATEAGWWMVAVQGWRRDRDPGPVWDDEGEWTLLADTGADTDAPAPSNRLRLRVWARRVMTAGAQTIRFPSVSFGAGFETFAASNEAVLLVLSGADDWWVRAAVEVPAWPPRRDRSDSDRWVPIEGAGILRRLGTGASPLRSPLYRDITTDPRAPITSYWPLETGNGSAVPVGPIAHRVGGPTFEADAGPVGGSGALILSGSAQSVSSRITPITSLPGLGSSGVWVVDWWLTPAATATATQFTVTMAGPGDATAVRVDLTATGWAILIATESGGGAFASAASGSASLAGSHSFALDVRQSGSDVVTSLYVDGVSVGADVTAGTVNQPVRWRCVNPDSNVEVALSHVAAWNPGGVGAALNAGSILAPRVANAGAGWVGEAAGRRIERLCAEEGIEFRHLGDLDDTATMGVQTAATLLDLLRQAADADLGVLCEARAAVGLLYRPRRWLYGRAALATLDYAAGQVAPPLEPMPDDQLTVNRAEVSRPDGATVIVERTDGPKGTAAIGVAPATPTVHLASDLQLADHGGWLVHRGTVDEDRVPAVSANLANPALSGDAALSAAVLALAEGDRLDVTNPPDDLPPDDIRMLVQGYAESIDQFVHTITVNTSPASPYTVGVRDTSIRGTDGAVTDSSFVAGTDTSLDVDVSGAGSLWTTSPPSGLKITVAGVDLEVTAIGAESSGVQTFTVVQAPTNGVTKTIPAGSAVQVHRDQQAVRGL